MRMKRSLNITIVAIVLLVSALVGCEASDEYAPKQRTQIEKFLISKSADYQLVGDSVFVFVAGNRYLDNSGTSDDVAVGELLELTKGDSLVFNFEAYTFTSTPASKPYYSNKLWLMEKYYSDFDFSHWDFTPRRIKLGSGGILKGLEDALVGRIEGDSVAVFLTSNNGYGDVAMGTIEENTALMWVLNIEEVKKNL